MRIFDIEKDMSKKNLENLNEKYSATAFALCFELV